VTIILFFSVRTSPPNQAFADVDRRIKSNPSFDTFLSGCTCVLAFLHGTEVTCANLGDSRCLIGSVDRHSGHVLAR
jgi:serine/threonine protein phosphatase PrpC